MCRVDAVVHEGTALEFLPLCNVCHSHAQDIVSGKIRKRSKLGSLWMVFMWLMVEVLNAARQEEH